MTNVAYMGWLGHKNIGDEACFDAIRGMMPKTVTWTTWNAGNFPHTKLPDLCILGGGTLLEVRQDVRGRGLLDLVNKGVPLVVWGTGVMPLRGPAVSMMHPDMLALLNKAKFVGVRGPISQNNLDISGFSGAHIIGDPALLLSTKKKKVGNKSKIIGINIGDTHGNLFGTSQHVVEQAIKLVYRIRKAGFTPILFPVWPQDIPVLKQVQKVIEVSIAPFSETAFNLIDFMKDCYCIVGLKLHAVVLSAAAEVPFISWGYREKCFDFVKSIELDEWVIRSDNQNLTDLSMNLLDTLKHKYSYVSKIIVNNIDTYRLKHITLSKLSESILCK